MSDVDGLLSDRIADLERILDKRDAEIAELKRSPASHDVGQFYGVIEKDAKIERIKCLEMILARKDVEITGLEEEIKRLLGSN